MAGSTANNIAKISDRVMAVPRAVGNAVGWCSREKGPHDLGDKSLGMATGEQEEGFRGVVATAFTGCYPLYTPKIKIKRACLRNTFTFQGRPVRVIYLYLDSI